ncbi:MAG: DNA methyltransferase [Bacteroidetes bacterium]|nr:DNA methyltransferase [Bacteroidota bacterium]
MNVAEYLDSINKRYKQGNTTEHSFRGDLQLLIESLIPGVYATNEPKRQKCGAPDYILTRNDIPVGFIEAKDVGDGDLQGKNKSGNKEQFDRYRESLTNLIFTDYLDFHFYKAGKPTQSVRIAEITDKAGKREIKPIPEAFTTFEHLIRDFALEVTQTIKSSKTLAEMMAAKARLLANVIEQALNSDEETSENSTLKDQLHAFKEILIHDITPKAFADVYAQTIAYGMFAARLHDPTLPTFSRQEAAELIPKSNPFLRKLFSYIAGVDIDDRIKWIVDSLVEVFLACNVEELLKNYGKSTKTEDPIIHFYETFLSEYDPKLRKARGVWYTPAPVVNFIVRAVDEVLKTEFNLPNGLADTSKTKVKVNLQETDKRYKENIKTVEQEVHKVQILDPATGTGTFLAEVVKQIHKKFEGQQGIWSNYVETHLLPRLNGFELLMASYAMAHLQLDLLFTETGFKPTKNQRLRVYLTNSLEESHPDTGTLFANWLSAEANEANKIKRDTPVMCIIGNPPYSGESANKGEWILKLMEDYKKEPDSKGKLQEKNSKWINADENKFIRYGQHFIEKNGSGILAYINPNSYLDNPTFRGMRWNLLKTFDKIYTIDLHGNSKKKEISPDGSIDENVFDIQQGVSINIFIKTGEKKSNNLGQVFHIDLFGKRDKKYNFLSSKKLSEIGFKRLNPVTPNYFFTPKKFNDSKKYNDGFSVVSLFKINGIGIVSKRDSLAFQNTKSEIIEKVQDIYNLSCDEIKIKYNKISWESRDGKVEFCKNNVMAFGLKDHLFVKYNYRPFDIKWTYYTGESKGFIGWPVKQVMQHFLNGDNLGMVIARQSVGNWHYIFITKLIGDFNLTGTAGRFGSGSYFPLYVNPQEKNQRSIVSEFTDKRQPNLNSEIITQISKILALKFTTEKETGKNTFAPIDILDYIYSVLHSPTYREKYKEFLKIDFPRVPYPKDKETFWKLVKLGGELREIHLLESPKVEKYITQYPVDGDNVVNKPVYKNGRVYINETQYFDNVPATAWEFYIGGYQPAQKWLKDRKERKLEFDDILHYQKIIVALSETARIMKEIDKIDFE